MGVVWVSRWQVTDFFIVAGGGCICGVCGACGGGTGADAKDKGEDNGLEHRSPVSWRGACL